MQQTVAHLELSDKNKSLTHHVYDMCRC